jgi:hypothetical protein
MLTLWRFSTEDGSGAEMAQPDHHRWIVETDLRDLKGTPALDQLSDRSVARVVKGLAVAILTYNLATRCGVRRRHGCRWHRAA